MIVLALKKHQDKWEDIWPNELDASICQGEHRLSIKRHIVQDQDQSSKARTTNKNKNKQVSVGDLVLECCDAGHDVHVSHVSLVLVCCHGRFFFFFVLLLCSLFSFMFIVLVPCSCSSVILPSSFLVLPSLVLTCLLFSNLVFSSSHVLWLSAVMFCSVLFCVLLCSFSVLF